jgi:hypothetical protein
MGPQAMNIVAAAIGLLLIVGPFAFIGAYVGHTTTTALPSPVQEIAGLACLAWALCWLWSRRR